MDQNLKPSQAETKPVQVLLIGNNPIDLSSILEKLNQIHGKTIMTEIAFDLKSIFERLSQFKPNFILIDDNIGKTQLSETVNSLAKSNKTKDIPITVLKNSNYQESYGEGSIFDYVLKANISADSLYKTLLNSLRFKRTRAFLRKANQRRKRLFKFQPRVKFDLQA